MTDQPTVQAFPPCPFCGGAAEWREDDGRCGVPFGLLVDHRPSCFFVFPMDDKALVAAWITRHHERENDKPPSHWTPDPKYDRRPQTAEEWDWHADGAASDDTFERSWNRLNFAYCHADPHAPDQMGLVLRVDIGRILARLTHYTAHRELLMEREAARSGEVGGEALTDIAVERRRQVEAEGWTPAHDDEHGTGELAAAAAAYAFSAATSDRFLAADPIGFWPWAPEWWKPSSPRRDLVKAGALIVAEIERIDRKARSGEAA